MNVRFLGPRRGALKYLSREGGAAWVGGYATDQAEFSWDTWRVGSRSPSFVVLVFFVHVPSER